MAAENLERDDKRVLHEVGVDRRVEDVDRSVITGGSEEREGWVEGDTSQSSSVVSDISDLIARGTQVSLPEGFVRLQREVQVEPTQFLVVTAHQDVVTGGVNVQTTDPLDSRLQCLDQDLTGEIVQSDVTLRGGEEPRFERVESDPLDRSARLLERRLGSVSRELVNEDRLVGG